MSALRINSVVLLTLFPASVLCGQCGSGAIYSSSSNAYSLFVSAGIQTEGPPANSCTLTVALSKGQRYVVMRFLFAHKVWHNFDLSDPVRSAIYDASSYPLYSILPAASFTRSAALGTTLFYVWVEDYYYPIPGEPDRHLAEDPYVGAYDLSAKGQKKAIQLRLTALQAQHPT